MMNDDIVDDLYGPYVAGGDTPVENAPPVKGRDEAERNSRRIARIEIQRRREVAGFDREIARLTGLRNELNGVHARNIEYWSKSIEGWHRAQLRDDPTYARTDSFAHGKSKMSAVTVAVQPTDTEAFIEWCLENGYKHLVKVKATLDAAAVRKECAKQIKADLGPKLNEASSLSAMTDDGEKLPGLFLERPAPRHAFVSSIDDTGEVF